MDQNLSANLTRWRRVMAGQLARRVAGAMPRRIVTDEATPPDAPPRPDAFGVFSEPWLMPGGGIVAVDVRESVLVAEHADWIADSGALLEAADGPR